MRLRQVNNDPLGQPWVIAPARPDLPPAPRISEVDAAPVRLSPGASILLIGFLSLGLWGLIWLLWRLL